MTKYIKGILIPECINYDIQYPSTPSPPSPPLPTLQWIIIDFGKSKEILKVEGHKRHAANYIEPEIIILGKKESPASNVYSFGKMLEAAVSSRSFCALFKQIISGTAETAASEQAFLQFTTRKFKIRV